MLYRTFNIIHIYYNIAHNKNEKHINAKHMRIKVWIKKKKIRCIRDKVTEILKRKRETSLIKFMWK